MTATATINLRALRHNFQQARTLVPQAHAMAVIKADGYGHGLVEVAETLADSDALAVARLAEAERLRRHGIGTRLVVLSEPASADTFRFCADRNLDLVVHSIDALSLLTEISLPKPIAVWLKYDSGMHRLGLNREQMAKLVKGLRGSANIREVCYMTHFDSADEADASRSHEQLRAFHQTTSGLLPADTSSANSAAIIRGLGATDGWIRPGIMLYGANPLHPTIQADHPLDLQPVMTLSAPVIALHPVPRGDSVGYNRRWRAERDSLIATVGIGYGDGYPRHADNGTPVRVGDQLAGLAGTVSMDMIGVDVTDCPAIGIGDEVTLWGASPSAQQIAGHAATIPYHLFTGVTSRVRRIYQR